MESLEKTESPAESRLKELKQHVNDTEELLGHLDFALNDFARMKVMHDECVSKTKQIHEMAEQLTAVQLSAVAAKDKLTEALSSMQSSEDPNSQCFVS